jgi:hypothetical protein
MIRPERFPCFDGTKTAEERSQPGEKTDLFSPPRLADGSAAERKMASCFCSAQLQAAIPATQKLPTPVPFNSTFKSESQQPPIFWSNSQPPTLSSARFCQSTMKAYFKKQRHTAKGS